MINLQLRKALKSDGPSISAIAIAAFGDREGPEISELIANLLKDPTAQPLLSLVAAANDLVVGHILFTAVQIPAQPNAAILAPLAVHPDYQNQGIGGQLIKTGLQQLQASGTELVFVLGHPGYYPRHGFSAAGIQGFSAPYPIPPEHADAWMVQALCPGIIGQVRGQVVCANALNDPKYWQE